MLKRAIIRLGALAVVSIPPIAITACGQAAQSAATATTVSTEMVVMTEKVASTRTPEPTATSEIATPLTETREPTATPDINLAMVLPEGNPKKGYTTAIRRGCEGCHTDEAHPERGPRFTAADDLPAVLERGELRIADPNYEGNATSSWEYFIESVYLPEAYFITGEWEEPMPTLYYYIMTEQELADIVAWIDTLE